jgi:hypothetical protein
MSSIFWVIIPYSPLKVNRHFWGTYRQNMEATCSSETSVDFQRTTRRYITEDIRRIHHNRYWESYTMITKFKICEVAWSSCGTYFCSIGTHLPTLFAVYFLRHEVTCSLMNPQVILGKSGGHFIHCPWFRVEFLRPIQVWSKSILISENERKVDSPDVNSLFCQISRDCFYVAAIFICFCCEIYEDYDGYWHTFNLLSINLFG